MPLEHLRLIAALVHTCPGAEVTLRCDTGEIVRVGRRPGSGMTPCEFRAATIALGNARSDQPKQPGADSAARIVDAEFGGALTDIGGGVARSRTPCGIEQRWIATTLPSFVVCDLLDGVGPDGLPEAAMSGDLRVDYELGTSVIAISPADQRYRAVLDHVAIDVAARCLTGELLHAATVTTTSVNGHLEPKEDQP